MSNPKVTRQQALQEFDDHGLTYDFDRLFVTSSSASNCVQGAHAIVVLTEWDEFKTYDYKAFYKVMVKPAFIFDGRNILDHNELMAFGFEVNCIGKALGKNTAQTPVSVNYR
jgi:UDPglucose 6-dehydrogenase